MKRFGLSIVLSILLSVTASAQEMYSEGVHYDVISKKATEKPEIIEVFSFWCGACFNFEATVKLLKTKVEGKAEFKKIHANTMGFASPELQDAVTKAMMIGRQLKKEAVINQAIFNYLHRTRARIASENDVRNILMATGVEGSDFDKLSKSFGINSMLKKNNKVLQQYSRALGSVPTFIVNGKYKATFERSMSPDQMIDLLIWLTKLD